MRCPNSHLFACIIFSLETTYIPCATFPTQFMSSCIFFDFHNEKVFETTQSYKSSKQMHLKNASKNELRGKKVC